MKQITPKDFYLDLPCSVVSIGCASETLHGMQFLSFLFLLQNVK